MLLGTFRSIVVHYSAGSSICAASKELKKAWSIHALEAAVILERLSSIVDNFNAHTIPIVIESDSSKIINLLNEVEVDLTETKRKRKNLINEISASVVFLCRDCHLETPLRWSVTSSRSIPPF